MDTISAFLARNVLGAFRNRGLGPVGAPSDAASLMREQRLHGMGDPRTHVALQQIQAQVESRGDPGRGDQGTIVDDARSDDVSAGRVE
ncbi:hypothetical protein AWN90_32320 [Nocardia terpenica]|uniref:Uncharacterized protein n=1 Tax=Nocardia terpenica TaxID=455432 RepID=A0A164MGP2_9NOCA|nr:hypothetical protein AWN90_32320 [Nocardia terpenica]